MRFIKKIFKKIDSEKVHSNIIQKGAAKRSLLFVVGAFLSALSFNLFYVPHNFVGGGLGGVAVILNQWISVNSTVVILVGNLIFITLSIFILGFRKSLMSMLGAIVYTSFVYFTEFIPELINFSFDNIILYVIAAGVVGGFGESLIYKAGFNSGGTCIIAEIIRHYTKKPIGQTLRYISFTIIAVGGFTFGYTAIMYSLIISVIATNLVDRFLIGISDSKTFFIQTSKVDEVTDFVLTILESGVTEFTTKGAYSNKKKMMLMCVVPTEKYSLLKNAINEIDPDAFIVVSDCYEVLGGTKRKKLLLDD